MLTRVPVDSVDPLHVPGHDFDARFLAAVLLVEQVVGLQVQHARGLPAVHEPAEALLAVLERVVTAALVHHQIAAGLVAGHGHQHLTLVVRVVPVGFRRGRLTATAAATATSGSRLPAPVHDGSVWRPDQYHPLRVVRLVHQRLGARRPARPASVQRLRHASAAAVPHRVGYVRQPVRDAVIRQRRAVGVPGRRFHEVLVGGPGDGAVE